MDVLRSILPSMAGAFLLCSFPVGGQQELSKDSGYVKSRSVVTSRVARVATYRALEQSTIRPRTARGI